MVREINPYLSQLLPYDPSQKRNGDILKGLKEYQTILKVALAAIRDFEEGHLEGFDCLVGENACEIRAIKMSMVAARSSINIQILQNRILDVLGKIPVLLAPRSISSIMKSDFSLGKIIEDRDLEVFLSSDEIFTIRSHLLTLMKTVKDSDQHLHSIFRMEVADPKKLKEIGEVSSVFANRLLYGLRKSLATSSVEFIRAEADVISDPDIIKMVSEEFTFQHNGLPCIPMFWTYKTVLETAEKNNIPIFLLAKFLKKKGEEFEVLDKEGLLFKRFNSNSSVLAHAIETADLEKPAIVVEGVVVPDSAGKTLSKMQWKNVVGEMSVVDVILAGAADHRQLPNEALETVFENLKDAEYENYKSMARKEGFSSSNPTTFFIQHVYAGRIGNAVKRISNSQITFPEVAIKEYAYVNN